MKVILVARRAGGGRRVQTVVRLRGVGRRNIGGSNLRLRCILRRGAGLGLRGVVSSSSRSLFCGFLFRRCVGDGVWVVRTWLCVLGSGPVVHKREDSRAKMPTNLSREIFRFRPVVEDASTQQWVLGGGKLGKLTSRSDTFQARGRED